MVCFAVAVLNYKRIQLWSKYFFRFEEGDNCYDEKINKVVNDLNIEIIRGLVGKEGLSPTPQSYNSIPPVIP